MYSVNYEVTIMTEDEHYPYYIFYKMQDCKFFLRRMGLLDMYQPFFVSQHQMKWINEGTTNIKPIVQLTKYNVYYALRKRDFKLMMTDYKISERINGVI